MAITVGMTMTIGQQKSAVETISAKKSVQATRVAEVGLSRLKNLVMTYPDLAYQDYNYTDTNSSSTSQWVEASNLGPKGTLVCGSSSSRNASADIKAVIGSNTGSPGSRWVSAGHSGTFRLINYSYLPDDVGNPDNGGIGIVEIEGTTETDATKLNEPHKSKAKLKVELAIKDKASGVVNGVAAPPEGPATLWVASFNNSVGQSLGDTNEKIGGNVMTQDRGTITATMFDCTKNFGTGNFTLLEDSGPFPDLPTLPPHLGTAPYQTRALTMSELCAGTISAAPLQNSFTGLRETIANVFIPKALAESEDDDEEDRAIPAGSSGTCTLPLIGTHTPDLGTTDTYSFLITELSSDTINIVSGTKVRLYVQGNIDMRGNSGIPAQPYALQIYGSNGSGTNGTAVNYALPGDPKIYTTTQVKLRGGANIYSFIFAPAANGAVDGSGSSGGFYSSVWVNSWVGSPFAVSSNYVLLQEPRGYDYSLLPPEIQPTTATPSTPIAGMTSYGRKSF
jgi:hypothetical protein